MPIPDVSELDQTVSTFIVAKANSAADRRAGRECQPFGMWAPGHMVVYVDGEPWLRGEEPKESMKSQQRRAAKFLASLKSPV